MSKSKTKLICSECGKETNLLICRGRRYDLYGDKITTETTENELICNDCSDKFYKY